MLAVLSGMLTRRSCGVKFKLHAACSFGPDDLRESSRRLYFHDGLERGNGMKLILGLFPSMGGNYRCSIRSTTMGMLHVLRGLGRPYAASVLVLSIPDTDNVSFVSPSNSHNNAFVNLGPRSKTKLTRK